MFITTLVVPCYNEAQRLDRFAFRRFLRHPNGVNILFVDDGSRDETADVIRALVDQTSGRCALLQLPRNMGKAEAVRHGCLKAFENRPEMIGYWDADLATPLEDVLDFRDQLIANSRLELVLGVRMQLLGRSIRRRRVRHWLSRVFATAASLALGAPVYDTQCGAKLFRATDRMRQAFASPFLSRWIFDVELLARLARMSRQEGEPSLEEILFEQPVRQWQDVAGSKLKQADFARAIVELARIVSTYRFGPAAPHEPQIGPADSLRKAG